MQGDKKYITNNYLKTSAKVRFAPTVLKRAQVKGLKES